MKFGNGNKLTEQGSDSIVIEKTKLSEFTASNVNTTGSANDNIYPTTVVDLDGNVVIKAFNH